MTSSHTPRKRFGQHFLVDTTAIRRILDAFGPAREDNVVEIGPGLGALTRPLLERLTHLHVVEIDRNLVAELRAEFPPERLTVHAADALKFDFSALGENIRLIGNLPYNISTPLLFHIASQASALRDALFMLQKEVVDRMVAQPGDAAYGRLSLTLQARFRMRRLFVIEPGAFRPPPKVRSAIVRLEPEHQSVVAAADMPLFEAIVAAGFQQRRKTLRNSLSRWLGSDDFARLSLDPGQRAEALDIDTYARIAAYLRRSAAQAGFICHPPPS
ncbi:MAG: ribosomal RNA small subunit methyltransferase A [Betaproteobacteria bacterium]